MSILTAWNWKLQAKDHSILLLIDNAGCHPTESQCKFSNIKVVCLPPNTTSVVQPLDLGIIQNTKVHYAECTSATEVGKSVDVLSAIQWISKTWNEVKEETVLKCFRKAGLLDADLNPLTRVHDIDPFC